MESFCPHTRPEFLDRGYHFLPSLHLIPGVRSSHPSLTHVSCEILSPLLSGPALLFRTQTLSHEAHLATSTPWPGRVAAFLEGLQSEATRPAAGQEPGLEHRPLPNELGIPVSRGSTLEEGALSCGNSPALLGKVAAGTTRWRYSHNTPRAPRGLGVWKKAFPGPVVEFLPQPSAAKGYSDSGMLHLKMIIADSLLILKKEFCTQKLWCTPTTCKKSAHTLHKQHK